MADFYRFVDPAYLLFPGESFSTVPGGSGSIGDHVYRRLNVTSGGVGSGGSAPADVAVAVGPNAHSMLAGFGEPGRAQVVNRGVVALARNTDILDDILRSSTPRYATAVVAASGTAVSLSGDVFVGDAGATVEQVVTVHDAEGHQLYDGVVPVSPVDIDDGTPGNSVLGTGFRSSGATVRLSAPYTGSVTVVYGTRTSLARTVEVERQVGLIPDVSNTRRATQALSTRLFGLDEAYRHARNPSPGNALELDSPGSGSKVVRDGASLTVAAPLTDQTLAYPLNQYPDPFMALFTARVDETVEAVDGAIDWENDGHIGFLCLQPHRPYEPQDDMSVARPNEFRRPGRFYASFLEAYGVDVRSSSSQYTYLPENAPATVNGRTVTLDSPYYFASSGYSMIMANHDLLKMRFPDGSEEVYIIEALTSDTTATLKTMALGDRGPYASGTGLQAPAHPPTAVQVSLFHVTKKFGLNTENMFCSHRRNNDFPYPPPQPLSLIDATVGNLLDNAAYSSVLELKTLIWETQQLVVGAQLTATGGYKAYGGTVHHVLQHKTRVITLAAGMSLELEPGAHESQLAPPRYGHANYVRLVQEAGSSGTASVRFDFDSSMDGLTCALEFQRTTGGRLDITFLGDVLFPTTGDQYVPVSMRNGDVVRWQGTVIGGVLQLYRQPVPERQHALELSVAGLIGDGGLEIGPSSAPDENTGAGARVIVIDYGLQSGTLPIRSVGGSHGDEVTVVFSSQYSVSGDVILDWVVSDFKFAPGEAVLGTAEGGVHVFNGTYLDMVNLTASAWFMRRSYTGR